MPEIIASDQTTEVVVVLPPAGSETVENVVELVVNMAPTGVSTVEDIVEVLAYESAVTDSGAYVQSNDISQIVKLTQAEYDLLSPPDPTILYVITPA